MTARDEWANVAHNLRVLADSIDAAIDPAVPTAVASAVPTGAAASGGGAPPPVPSPRPRQEESAFTSCPAHPDRNWSDGRFGKYCSGQEPEGQPHDGNWYNDKGYCRVTPRSAGAWLKQHRPGV